MYALLYVANKRVKVIYIATLIESFAVVTRGPELIAGSMPILRNKNGKNNPRVVATIIAENIAVPNAKISRSGETLFSVVRVEINIEQTIPPNNPQLSATRSAMRISREKTWLNFNAAK